MSKFNDATTNKIAEEFFSGVSNAKLARKYNCDKSTITVCVVKKLKLHKNYNKEAYIDLLKIPGSGINKSAFILWHELNKQLTEKEE